MQQQTLPWYKQLRFQLPLMGALLILVPMVIWTVGNIFFAQTFLLSQYRSRLTAEAQLMADRLDEKTAHVTGELATVWRADDAAAGVSFSARAEAFLDFHPDILGLALVTQDGQVLSLREQDAGRSLFASPAPDLNLAQVASGTVYWADGATPHLLLVGPWVEGAMPVRAVADLPLAGWVELQPFLLAKEGAYVYLVDDQGRLLHASTPAPMPMGADLRTIPEVADFLRGQDERGEPSFTPYTGLLGAEVMGVQAPVEGLGWGVVVEIPAESILSRLTRMKQTLYGLTLLSVLIGVVLGGLATAWMVRPVSRLVQVARRLGAGDLSARASDFPNNEVGVLAAAFNQMAESIQAGRASLAASERRYRTLTDNLPDIVFRVRLQPDSFIEYISPAVVRILGISPESCYGPPNVAFRHIHPDDREKLLDLVADPKQMTRSFTLRWRRPDGVVVWMEHHVTVMTDDSGAVVAVEGVARDITRRLQDQQRIQRTNALAAALNQVVSRLLRAETPERVLDILVQELAALRIHTFVLLFDEPQPFDRVVEASTPPLRVVKVQVSGAAQRLISSTLGSRLYHVHLQVTEGGVLHRFLLNRTSRFDRNPLERAVRVLPTALRPLAARVLRQLGQTDGMGVVSLPLVVEERVYGLFALWSSELQEEDQDLATVFGGQVAMALEQARLHAETKRQAQQIQLLANSAPQGLLLLDKDLHILLANPTAATNLALLTGWPADRLLGRQLTQMGPYLVQDLLEPPVDGLAHELVLEGPPQHIFEFSAHPIAGQGDGVVEGWVVSLVDVTETRRRAAYLRSQERLATVGQLAAGVAHDFNNILAVIVLYSQMLRANPALPKAPEYLATIYEQALHAERLVQQLLDFSRSAVMQRSHLLLQPFLKEMVKLWRRTLPENIEIRLEAPDVPLVIDADASRIQEALMNLALNARDAMPEGGVLSLELSQVVLLPGDEELLPEMEPGAWVRLRIRDTGCGMTPEVLRKAFDPFFTTKEPGQGTGLGLAQVYGIVKQHGGEILAESQPHAGATFTIYLPLVQDPAMLGEWTGPDQMDAPLPGHGETILVVEDNPDARGAFVDILRDLGYQVLEAGDGEEALALYTAHRDEIDLVLSDMVMPRMGGLALYQALRQQNPHVKLAIVSGYPLGAAEESNSETGILAWLSKPFDMVTLSRHLRAMLEEEPLLQK